MRCRYGTDRRKVDVSDRGIHDRKGNCQSDIGTLLIRGVLAFLIIKGVPYMNYVTGAYLALMSVIHIIPNIQGHHWFYLAEGIIDLIAAVVLFTSGRTKES